MKLFLYPNVYNEVQIKQATSCVAMLEKQGHRCAMSAEVSETASGIPATGAFSAAESDMIVSLGGDGAVLRAAQLAIREGKPLIGINSGRLGYLCALDYAEIDRWNEIVPSCVLSERALLEFQYQSRRYVAVNDVILAKKNFGSSVQLSVSVQGFGDYQVRGDGLVISTPTGSTAYNYSAGGPIIDPRCNSIAITPLCSHCGTLRPIVVGNQNRVAVAERDDSALILADGIEIGGMKGTLQIYRSEHVLHLYTTRNEVPRIQ